MTKSKYNKKYKNFSPSTPTLLESKAHASARVANIRPVCVLTHYPRNLNVSEVGAPYTLVFSSSRFPSFSYSRSSSVFATLNNKKYSFFK